MLNWVVNSTSQVWNNSKNLNYNNPDYEILFQMTLVLVIFLVNMLSLFSIIRTTIWIIIKLKIV